MLANLLIQARFAQQPGIYKRFLEILQTYQREGRPIQEIYAQISQLLTSAPDLVDGFKMFLLEPPAHSLHQGSPAAPVVETAPQIGHKEMQEQIPNSMLSRLNAQEQQQLTALQRAEQMADLQMKIQLLNSRQGPNGTQLAEVAQHIAQPEMAAAMQRRQQAQQEGVRRSLEGLGNTAARRQEPFREFNEVTSSGNLLPGSEKRKMHRFPPELSEEDKAWINRRAVEMDRATSEYEMIEILKAMEPRILQRLKEERIDPLIYHFGIQATKEFRIMQG